MAAKASEEDHESASEPAPDRPLTIDDVPRLGSGTGIAIGCGLVVVAAIAVFWVVRVWLL